MTTIDLYSLQFTMDEQRIQYFVDWTELLRFTPQAIHYGATHVTVFDVDGVDITHTIPSLF